MELNDYQKQAMMTCTDTSHNLMYMLTGLSAEVGEIHDKIAKAIRKDQVRVQRNNLCTWKDVTPEDFTMNLIRELGDVLWFVAGLADVLGVPLQQVADMNISKLKDRAKRNVIIGDGDDR